MFENVLLEPEQERLLATLVEADRNLPRVERQRFVVAKPMGKAQSLIFHPGLLRRQAEAYEGDIEVLSHIGLLAVSYERNTPRQFDITPRGFAYYEWLKQRVAQPVQRVETEITSYLLTHEFQQRYSKAYERWSKAEEMLWVSDWSLAFFVIRRRGG